MKQNRITKLFDIKYPIIQGGMIWVSGARLVAAVSNAGGLGLIGAGSMTPELLSLQIEKTKQLTDKIFGVNLPVFYRHSEEMVDIIIDHGVKVVFTSAGSPKAYTVKFKEAGIIVVHVAASPKLAKKCELAGVDAVVVEGFEAGGHNGRDELTSMVLVPQAVDAVKIPVIAAGGIADGRAMAAAFALGASGVQIGSRFVASLEASCHENFKESVLSASATDTVIALKSIMPVRLIKNDFAMRVLAEEMKGSDGEKLFELLGRGRAKSGMFLGDLKEGELEIGQVSGIINDILSVSEIIEQLVEGYDKVVDSLR